MSTTKTKERKERFTTSSGIELKNHYTPSDAELDYQRDLGEPGQYPFTRGVYETMYRGRMWTMRQYAGFSTAAESNRRYKYLLEQGTTGLSVAFDLPTQIGYDSDHSLASGEVGRVGVAIDSLADMETLFDGIPLDRVSTSMTINATAAILLALYIAVGRKQGVSQDKLSGTIQNDILKEYIARGDLHLSAEGQLADCDRHLCLLRTRSAELEHDFDFGLSHPRSRFDRCAGSRVHAGRRHHLCASRARCWFRS